MGVPHTLDALGGHEALWASLRTLSDAPPEESYAGVRLGEAI